METENRHESSEAHCENPSSSAQAIATEPLPTQQQIRNSQVTTALIVLIVFLLFLMLMLSLNGKFSQARGSNPNLTALELNNDQLRAEANAERKLQGLPPLPASASSAYTTAQRLRADANSLAQFTSQWQMELEASNEAINELNAKLATRDETIKHLYGQITDLQTQLSQSADAANQLTALANDLQIANEQIGQYQIELNEFQNRPSNDQFTELRKELNNSLDENNKLKLRIDELSKPTESISSNKLYDEALTEIENLRGHGRQQGYEIQRLRAELDRPSLLAKSAKDLSAPAAKLFAKLSSLEGSDKKQLEAAYENIRETMNAQIIHRHTFAKDASTITFDREKILQNILEQRRDKKSLFLVVGYTSKSGEPDAKRELSCTRAATLASMVKMLKTDDQQVKAIHLGETERFSTELEMENQICEIWEIQI
ncbi:MAG: OmpA family protein [Akkermansiaceae bacterium]